MARCSEKETLCTWLPSLVDVFAELGALQGTNWDFH